MKALFIIFHGFDASNGISQKIRYQLKALNECGLEAHLCYIDENGSKKRMVDDEVIADYGNGLKSKLLKRIEYKSISDYVISQNVKFVYIRSDHNASLSLIIAIHRMKCNGAKVVMEIPTYPYDSEYIGWQMKKRIIQDHIFRHSLSRELDRIITYSDYKKIWGRDTIQISNGIDFDEIPLKQNVNDTSKEFHLIGVAEIHLWHGFDRIITGLAEYYKDNPQYKIYFHIVGYFYSDFEKEEISSLIQKVGISSYVIFHGKQHGKGLDDIFEQCDFGIGSLGRHRVGIDFIKTLKNREYAARGIPFIYSETDSDFDDKPYTLKAPADETPIDILSIVKFYNSLKIQPIEIRNSIANLSWRNQMQKVIDTMDIKRNHRLAIAYLHNSFAFFGGIERVLTDKINYFAEHEGYDVTVITNSQQGRKFIYPLSSKAKFIDVDVSVYDRYHMHYIKRLCYYFKQRHLLVSRLRQIIEENKIDIVIGTTYEFFLMDVMYRLRDIAHIVFETHVNRRYLKVYNHSNLFKSLLYTIRNKRINKMIRAASAFVTLTDGDAKAWSGIRNSIVIPNTLSVAPVISNDHLQKYKRIISVGRLDYQKGYDLLLKAWSEISEQYSDWRIDVYGDGVKKDELIKIRNEYHLQKSFFFHEAISNIYSEYKSSDFFVMSSRFEGFGMVLIEAMSYGLPCVSFNCDYGPSSIIKDGVDGLLIDDGNVDSLAEGIKYMIENDEKRISMGKNAQNNVLRYNPKMVMPRWKELLEMVYSQYGRENEIGFTQ